MRLCRRTRQRPDGAAQIPEVHAQRRSPESAGEAAAKDDEEYRKRSPVTYAAKLSKPLLVHGNTNDETVHVAEIRNLVAALQEAHKQFEYKIYQAAPGGHHFNRIDTQLARESRAEIYAFLRKYLKP